MIRGSLNGDAEALMRLHKALTILWLAASIPICVLLANSVPLLVFISVYAVVCGHWSSWQAARAEVRVDAQ